MPLPDGRGRLPKGVSTSGGYTQYSPGPTDGWLLRPLGCGRLPGADGEGLLDGWRVGAGAGLLFPRLRNRSLSSEMLLPGETDGALRPSLLLGDDLSSDLLLPLSVFLNNLPRSSAGAGTAATTPMASTAAAISNLQRRTRVFMGIPSLRVLPFIRLFHISPGYNLPVLRRRLDIAVISAHPVGQQPEYAIAFGTPAITLHSNPGVAVPAHHAALAGRRKAVGLPAFYLR